MQTNEVIVEVLAEGSSRVLYGLRQQGAWLFSLDFIESTATTRNSQTTGANTCVVDSFSDALVLFDRYPWFKLAPSMVHPEFRAEIIKAVVFRENEVGLDSRYHDRWEECCSPVANDPLSAELEKYKVTESITGSDSWMYDDID